MQNEHGTLKHYVLNSGMPSFIILAGTLVIHTIEKELPVSCVPKHFQWQTLPQQFFTEFIIWLREHNWPISQAV